MEGGVEVVMTVVEVKTPDPIINDVPTFTLNKVSGHVTNKEEWPILDTTKFPCVDETTTIEVDDCWLPVVVFWVGRVVEEEVIGTRVVPGIVVMKEER